MNAVSRKQVERDWKTRGFSCQLWADPPGHEWPGFVHRKDELVCVLEGEMEFEFDGKTLRPGIGEELLIPAETEHTARNIGKTRSRWLYGYRK